MGKEVLVTLELDVHAKRGYLKDHGRSKIMM
jgi:hypothetical protein